jgi:hypothetical protein
MSNEVLTTSQTAETLGISINCLRQWKSRKSDLLIEGTHWVTGDNNQVLWTPKGLEALQQIKGGNEPMTDDVTEPLQEPITEPLHNLLQRYTPLVEGVANSVTQGLLHQIDQAVTRNIKSAIATPMTATECVEVLQSLGLKPINTELLLTGNQTNLLTQSKEN